MDVIRLIKEINTMIKNDDSLKVDFCIGHSYFTQPMNKSYSPKQKIKDIFEFEIIPLVQEYWEYDDRKRC